jgi:DMSO/TMAO reductase YedYZ heme-binding membrane subunit/nitrite reductase/ring-hydroxylating ferredoxin subunit
MSADYRVVQWTPFKKTFDVVLIVGVAAFIAAFVAGALASQQGGEHLGEVQVLIRATGAAAFALLTLILAVGPLARLTPRVLPLLYNRRHMGVACFLIAFVHATLVVVWYHGFSDINPLVSLLVSNPRYTSIGGFPFESLGLAALFVLFVMAATSHDFWNANLGPRVWKALHMSVYVAYGLLVAHVMLGAVQGGKGLVYAAVVAAGATALAALHIVAARREAAADRADADAVDGWLAVGEPGAIADGRAQIVTPPEGERIAVFRNGDKIHAVSNVCRHQGGPLGEGRLVDGCVTCPWHGFQYRPEDGCAPAPYRERIAVYPTRIDRGVVWVRLAPAPLGVAVAPSMIGGA